MYCTDYMYFEMSLIICIAMYCIAMYCIAMYCTAMYCIEMSLIECIAMNCIDYMYCLLPFTVIECIVY